jgi:hypothetical protein
LDSHVENPVGRVSRLCIRFINDLALVNLYSRFARSESYWTAFAMRMCDF